MSYEINKNNCIGCHTCMAMCPVGAISIGDAGKCVIDANKCIDCGTCASVCPVMAIAKAATAPKNNG
ncbi:MAG: 4Fe-4S binding protein [Rickettsiales bacterium]|nr:4Fe-4S binding protein [Rickettsiales bacterium]